MGLPTRTVSFGIVSEHRRHRARPVLLYSAVIKYVFSPSLAARHSLQNAKGLLRPSVAIFHHPQHSDGTVRFVICNTNSPALMRRVISYPVSSSIVTSTMAIATKCFCTGS
jgi:hypothetical protein